MCLSCTPFCGKCKPPGLMSFDCPGCSEKSVLTREECLIYMGHMKQEKHLDMLSHGEDFPACEHCGINLYGKLVSKIQPRECIYRGIVCGYPCGRHNKKRTVGDSTCSLPVPLRRLEK
jgi:hypothetical protein